MYQLTPFGKALLGIIAAGEGRETCPEDDCAGFVVATGDRDPRGISHQCDTCEWSA